MQQPLDLELGLRLWMGCQVWMPWHPGNPTSVIATCSDDRSNRSNLI
ncbi:MAG TPA: hypothetical protein V6D07_06075 [Trichocoleus sp.]